MGPKRRREQVASPLPGTRIRGRQRGFETLWTLDRFAEVIRSEVSKGIDRAWPPDRIRSWIRDAYGLDPRSMPSAAKAIDTVLGMFGLTSPAEDDATERPPRASAARAARRGQRKTHGKPAPHAP
jgi:hypothetical protein